MSDAPEFIDGAPLELINLATVRYQYRLLPKGNVGKGVDCKKCHLFHHEEHEGLEGVAVFTSCVFIEPPHKTKLFNPCFNNFTLKLIRKPGLVFTSFT